MIYFIKTLVGDYNDRLIVKKQTDIVAEAGIKPHFAGGIFSFLTHNNIVIKEGKGNYRFFKPGYIDLEEYTQRRDDKLDQLMQVREFVGNRSECRMKQITEYFESNPVDNCGICDNCL